MLEIKPKEDKSESLVMHLRIANGDLMDPREEEDMLWRIAKARKDKALATKIEKKEEKMGKEEAEGKKEIKQKASKN